MIGGSGEYGGVPKSDNSACSIFAHHWGFLVQVVSRQMLTLAFRATAFTTYHRVDSEEPSDPEYEGLEWVGCR